MIAETALRVIDLPAADSCAGCRDETGHPFLQSRQSAGALQMCAGMLIIPFLDVFAKLLGETHGPLEITFWRFFMQTALMLPFMVSLNLWTVPQGTILMQASRGLLLAMATVFFFAALKHLPMAEAIAIFFAQPMILTVLSALVLGERLRARRIAAILAGLGGTMVILQPSLIIFGWPLSCRCVRPLSMAFYMVLTRKLASDVNPYQMQFFGSVVAMIVLGGLTAPARHSSCRVPACRCSPASKLHGSSASGWRPPQDMPSSSGQPAMHRPTFWPRSSMSRSLAPRRLAISYSETSRRKSTFIGVGIIIASGIYLLHRERQAEQRRKTIVSPAIDAGRNGSQTTGSSTT